MVQADIDRSVAAATGESIQEVQRRGFVIADLLDPEFDPEPSQWPLTLDSDFEVPTNSSLEQINDY
jgi:hypothetical protein